MKKFIVIILTCICLLPIFGCSDKKTDKDFFMNEEIEFEEKDEIEFTAEKPINGYDYICERDEALSLTQEYDSDIKNEYSCCADYYKDFTDYYKENVKDNVDGLLYFTNGDVNWNASLPSDFVRFNTRGLKNGKHIDPSIQQDMTLSASGFFESNTFNAEMLNKLFNGSISLRFNFSPVKVKAKKTKFRLEFGTTIEAEEYSDYVNIYRGDTCIGTCYYRLFYANPRKPMTYNWFTDYLGEHLRCLV